MNAKTTLRTPEQFTRAGLIAAADAGAIAHVLERYAAAMTPELLALADPENPEDPIARQFVPDNRELATLAAELADPIGDDAHSPTLGLVHRYDDRVLLKITTVCPVYCRFCFRREMVGPNTDGVLPQRDLARALAYIADNSQVREVILTGGDPLGLSPRRIESLMLQLRNIEHVRTVRVHTRIPVALPARIDEAMIAALRRAGKPVYIALHANHPRELSGPARAACARLIDAGIPMVSQSVLLAGVNDNSETLIDLMRAFIEMRVKPYYLHHPDLAPGTSHFRLPIERGRKIVGAMQSQLSGLAQPRYVLDLPGGFGKVSLEDGRAAEIEPGVWRFHDRFGIERRYSESFDPASTGVSKKPDCG